MDTMTYASVAALSMSVTEHHKHAIATEVEFIPLDLSYLRRESRD